MTFIVPASRRRFAVDDRFGRLKVSGVPFYVDASPHPRPHVVCECDCGSCVMVNAHHLASGRTRSCGCLLRDVVATHGAWKDKLYSVWGSMKQRCNNPRDASYRRYGGRGIFVCKEWESSFVTFRDWAISTGYAIGLTIDRVDNDGPYSPENCRLASRRVQQNNMRRNRLVEAFGETKTVSEWTRDGRCVVTKAALCHRLDIGVNPEDAIVTARSDIRRRIRG